MRKGIDVSQWQGEIDWRKVKEWGAEFALIRAGYGRFAHQEDRQFRKNIAGAAAAGAGAGAATGAGAGAAWLGALTSSAATWYTFPFTVILKYFKSDSSHFFDSSDLFCPRRPRGRPPFPHTGCHG